jgi:hypothetical protein
MAKVKWEKILTESWVSQNKSLSEEEAKIKLIESEFEIRAAIEEREGHEQLQAAKEIVKDLNAGFSSAIKYEKAKIEFLLEEIEARRNAAAGIGQ